LIKGVKQKGHPSLVARMPGKTNSWRFDFIPIGHSIIFLQYKIQANTALSCESIYSPIWLGVRLMACSF
jgi:hypothetical protein